MRSRSHSILLKKALFLSFFVGMLSSGLFAVEMKMGGTVFAHYEYVTSKHLKDGTVSQDYNAFEVSRIYLNSDIKYSDTVSAFLNLEANLLSREAKNNRVYLKNAELRWGSEPAKLYFGLIGVPWRALEETIWHRFIGKDLEDIEGIGNATDRGVRVSGKIPYLTYHLMVSNGEGTGGDGVGGNETTVPNGGGRLKEFLAQISLMPFEQLESLKGLKISIMGLKGNKNEITLKNRIFAGLSYDSKCFKAMANYYNADNSPSVGVPSRGEGFSAVATVYPNEKWWLIARFDKYNPNIHAGGFSHNRTIYGLGTMLTKGVRFALDHQYTEQETRTIALQDESVVFVHSEIKF